ncbi:LPXTG cell wall anchor domain-containing protein [Kitasatospora sp. NPDC093558]|uniref:LPXTG cell wall anchor domain-containing protein n=1 Tax=Kitasatospora sp. NPDC093558 TaxID=3155201 RepID=UPI00341A505E
MTMRSPRLPAACALLVLTAGTVAAGAAPALADAAPTTSASPTAPATGEPTAPATTPAATPTATGTPTAAATPAATGSPWPSDCPEGPMASPVPATATGPAGGAVVTGGAPGELSVTFDNTSSATVHELATTFTLTGKDGAATGLDVKLHAPGGDWKPLTGTNAGTYQVERGRKLTLQVRVTAAAGAALGEYRFAFAAKSEVLPSGSAPAKKYTCPQLTASAGGTFTVTDHAPATTSATSAPATPAPAVSPTRTPAQLADTGGGTNSTPIAVTGAATIALGAALLLLTRRRETATEED